jgi:hypothetical protein
LLVEVARSKAVLEPIECAIEEMSKKVEELRQLVEARVPDMKLLQMRLQGALSAMVPALVSLARFSLLVRHKYFVYVAGEWRADGVRTHLPRREGSPRQGRRQSLAPCEYLSPAAAATAAAQQSGIRLYGVGRSWQWSSPPWLSF